MLLPFSVQAVEYGFYGRGKDRSFHKEMYGTIHSYDRNSRNSLGLSTEISLRNNKKGLGWVWFDGDSYDEVHGHRTGGLKSSVEGNSMSLSSGLPEMAKTTMPTDGDIVVSDKGFMEPPDYTVDTPIGDEVIPLLLFLLTMVLYKIKFRK